MKKLTSITLFLAVSLFATPMQRVRGGAVIRHYSLVTVTWQPLGIWMLCAALPGALPGCGLVNGVSAWWKITTINGISTYELLPADAHQIE